MSDTIESGKTRSGIRAVFAPDFRELGPYQQLQAEALRAQNVSVDYLQGYRRGMPLFRGLRGMRADLLHMHYPVHYFMRGARWDALRKLRFPADLLLAAGRMPLVYTVHDLYPLDSPPDFLVRMDTRFLLDRASALIAHSDAARERIAEVSPGSRAKCTVIPHGDLSVYYGAPLPRAGARAKLGLGEEGRVCFMFGIITPNKGAEEVIDFWKRARPDATLVIAGKPKLQSYARDLETRAAGAPNILLRFTFQTDEEVRLWMSAADCVLINYKQIFTSGVASLARSYGVPVLLPARHATVDLQEPGPSVFRFDRIESDFAQMLEKALACKATYADAEKWRKSIAWEAIAIQTRRVYEEVVG